MELFDMSVEQLLHDKAKADEWLIHSQDLQQQDGIAMRELMWVPIRVISMIDAELERRSRAEGEVRE